jgi:hypothetical protein
MTSTKAAVVGLVLFVSACAGDRDGGELSKDDVGEAAEKGDTSAVEKLCRELGLAPGCDLCDARGWYDDGVCDSFCAEPDPDCPATASCDTVFADIDLCADEESTLDQCLPEVGSDAHDATSECCAAKPEFYCGLINDVVVDATVLPLPAGLKLTNQQGHSAHLAVKVTGADRFSQEALNKVILAGQHVELATCSGVLRDGPVELSKNTSVDSFLSFLRSETRDWTGVIPDAGIDALEAHLTAKGKGNFQVFFGSSPDAAVCGFQVDVSYNLVWNTKTDEVLWFVFYPRFSGDID